MTDPAPMIMMWRFPFMVSSTIFVIVVLLKISNLLTRQAVCRRLEMSNTIHRLLIWSHSPSASMISVLITSGSRCGRTVSYGPCLFPGVISWNRRRTDIRDLRSRAPLEMITFMLSSPKVASLIGRNQASVRTNARSTNSVAFCNFLGSVTTQMEGSR